MTDKIFESLPYVAVCGDDLVVVSRNSVERIRPGIAAIERRTEFNLLPRGRQVSVWTT